MPEDQPEIEIDFAGEMNLLADEAHGKKSSPGAQAYARAERNEILLAVGQLVRPLAQELENLRRTTADQGLMLTALGRSINAQHSVPPALDAIVQQIGRLGSIESANQKLFDALHTELKSYKDNFLFDALQKPYIGNLISLFDDLSEVHLQMTRRLEARNARAPTAGPDASPGADTDTAFLHTLAGNVENQIHHMIEVFLRMDVALSRTCVGAPMDKKSHRIVGFEPAATVEDDGIVARSVKPGFAWRDRSVRPEDVIVRRWKAPAAPAAEPVPASSAPASPAPASPASPASVPALASTPVPAPPSGS